MQVCVLRQVYIHIMYLYIYTELNSSQHVVHIELKKISSADSWNKIYFIPHNFQIPSFRSTELQRKLCLFYWALIELSDISTLVRIFSPLRVHREIFYLCISLAYLVFGNTRTFELRVCLFTHYSSLNLLTVTYLYLLPPIPETVLFT